MRRYPIGRMREKAQQSAAPLPLVLNAAGFDIIAELKLRSPAAGALRAPDEDIGTRVRRYATAGAVAVSVLTEPSEFQGELAHLELTGRALLPAGIPAISPGVEYRVVGRCQERRAAIGVILAARIAG